MRRRSDGEYLQGHKVSNQANTQWSTHTHPDVTRSGVRTPAELYPRLSEEGCAASLRDAQNPGAMAWDWEVREQKASTHGVFTGIVTPPQPGRRFVAEGRAGKVGRECG